MGLDIRFALKALRSTPGFTGAVVLTLALGIGATTAMVSVLDVALRRELPFPEPDRLVMGRATFRGNVNPSASFPDYLDYREHVPSLASLATIGGGAPTATLSGLGEPRAAGGTSVSANLFATLGVPPELGTWFSIEEMPEGGIGEIILSHAIWQEWLGGSPDVVGRTILVDGRPQTLVGVMPAGFRFLYDTDFWLPPWTGSHDPSTRRFHNWLLVGRLRPGATLERVRLETDLVSTRLQQAYPESNRTKALQVDDLHAAMAEAYRPSLLLLTGGIVLVLLIACGNVASLLMARGADRTSELSVRAALGAGRGRLLRQLMVECVVLALAAGAFGVGIAVALQRLVLRLVSMDLLGVAHGGLSPTMLTTALAVSALTVVVFGVYPSLSASRASPAENLRETGRTTGSRSTQRYRSGLVVFQVAVSVVLLVGSGLLITSFQRLRGVDAGFRVTDLLTATVALPADRYTDPESRIRFFQDLREAITALPGVESVGIADRLPLLQPWGNFRIWDPDAPPAEGVGVPSADRRVALPGYFETMGMSILEGRGIDDNDVADSAPVVVLSRSGAERVFPGESALGRQLAVDAPQGGPRILEVVGVVEDHRSSTLTAVRPSMFFPHAQSPELRMRLAVAAPDPLGLVRPVQARLRELDGDLVLSDVQTMEAAVSRSLSEPRSLTMVLGMFAAVAVVLAAIGLYGVLAFFVARRRPEIGVRVALGATGGRVLRLVVLRGLGLAALGAGIGLLGSLWAARLLAAVLFETSVRDPAVFAGVGGLLLVVVVLACALPTWRALRVDPVEALRSG